MMKILKIDHLGIAVHSIDNGKYFWFSYVGKIVGKLYVYLYEDVPSSMRCERKYLIFRKAFEENNADQLKLALYHTI